MRYSANISGVLGRRITPIQIYPFHFPSKRAKDVHSGCFTILARRSSSQRKYFNRMEGESFFGINYSKAYILRNIGA
jgi:hypothetical protein